MKTNPYCPSEIVLTEEEYCDLICARKKLQALEQAGVDNWAGYDDAMETLT